MKIPSLMLAAATGSALLLSVGNEHVSALDEESANAATLTMGIRTKLQQRLEAAVEEDAAEDMEVGGTQNCWNKCALLFNNQQYMVNAQLQQDTYEYSACRAGCSICDAVISNNDTNTKCMVVCKNTDWTKNVDINGDPFPIHKGIIQPDKACLMGCILGTCQYVCQGGTPDASPNAQNQNLWWQGDADKGCSIKTGSIRPGGYYAQNSQYNNWNQPAGSGGQQECCSNAFALCNYNDPNTNTDYYKNLLSMAKSKCAGVPPGNLNSKTAICNYFTEPGNCGNPL